MEIVTFRDADGWGLRVNGKDQIRGESFGVISAVEESLRREGKSITWEPTEADEVAYAILQSL